HASKVHSQIRTEFETAYCTFWEKTPYSLGAFASGGGNNAAGGGRGEGVPRVESGLSNAQRLEALGKPDNRIYLGCGAVSGNGGWQEGAVTAAWKQVKALHERVMTSKSTTANRPTTA